MNQDNKEPLDNLEVTKVDQEGPGGSGGFSGNKRRFDNGQGQNNKIRIVTVMEIKPLHTPRASREGGDYSAQRYNCGSATGLNCSQVRGGGGYASAGG